MTNKAKRRTILILMGRYLPGYKDGGPVRTIINLVDHLGEEYDFKIVTNDRDHGDLVRYPNIKVNDWNIVGKAKVYYVPPKGFTFRLIKSLTDTVDLVYSCGFYDDYGYKSLILKKLGIIHIPLVIASMGSFSTGAFAIKHGKKWIFVKGCKMLGLFNKIIWSVTSGIEENELKTLIGINSMCLLAEDLPRKIDILPVIKYKDSNTLNIFFFSRICKMKNLKYAINIVSKLRGKIRFTILGNIEDRNYWHECRALLERLPDNIVWDYGGEINTYDVINTLKQYHVLIFPTRGENYGHVIFEALACGCVPVISDKTPWKDFDQNDCGNVINLDDQNLFIDTLENYSVMNQELFQRYSDSAINYAKKKREISLKNTGYRKILNIKELM